MPSTEAAHGLHSRSTMPSCEAGFAQASVLPHDGSDTLTRSVAKATATDIYGNVLNSAGF